MSWWDEEPFGVFCQQFLSNRAVVWYARHMRQIEQMLGYQVVHPVMMGSTSGVFCRWRLQTGVTLEHSPPCNLDLCYAIQLLLLDVFYPEEGVAMETFCMKLQEL